MTPTSSQVVAHLASVYGALYRVLGEAAPTLGDDAFVVRAHEMSRAFGALALESREYVAPDEIEDHALVGAVLEQSVALDPGGALLLYAVAVVIGPRLLVSLRDARIELATDAAVLQLIDHGADRVVAEILAVRGVAARQAPIEDRAWQASARDLITTFDGAGYGESLGLGD